MVKNITLSADDSLIQLARRRASAENMTLNELFRRWLEQYVAQTMAPDQYVALMDRLDHVQAERKFSREEMNERR
jgi:hypothetical protein